MSNEVAIKNSDVVQVRMTALERAIEKGLDADSISKMMDLQERYEANISRREFVSAMSAFKKECPAVIGKDRTADYGAGKAKYSYATTGAIVSAITPILSKNGLHLSWETQQKEKAVTVTCHVTHAGGHRESATLTGPHDESGGKNPIQTIGSSVHYLQRYTMVSVLGLATADMDDDPDNKPPARDPIKEPQAAEELFTRGNIEDVEEREGLKNGKTWKKFGIKLDNNPNIFGTFDKTLGELAIELKNEPVVLHYVIEGKFNTLKKITQD